MTTLQTVLLSILGSITLASIAYVIYLLWKPSRPVAGALPNRAERRAIAKKAGAFRRPRFTETKYKRLPGFDGKRSAVLQLAEQHRRFYPNKHFGRRIG